MFRFIVLHTGVKYTFFSSVQNFRNLKFLRYLGTHKNIPAKEKEVLRALLKPAHEPSEVEAHRYEVWESKNYFKPSKSVVDSFVVLLPPPNVTGTLHLGHAMTCTFQDILLRWKRMKGESVLWVPGIDHAGIATQAAVEKHLCSSTGLSRHELGKEKFLKLVWEWKNEKEAKIIKQLKKLGASLDWSKLIFTMDSTHSQLVTNSFIQLYNSGMIYRKKSLVNWSCALNSSISDIEVDWIHIDKCEKFSIPGYDQPIKFGYLYEFAYKIYNEDDEVVVSTTRPETILGDVAVAIHPSHPFLSKLKNKYVWHPFRNEKIPIIVDDSVDPEFGSGAVKITPSHSPTDFEIALKHNLECINVINEVGLINKIGTIERLHGLKRMDARWATINELKRLNLFKGFKEYSMTLPICSRSGDVIEYIPKEQWFLKCDSLVEKAVNAVKNGDLKIQPESYKNVWYNWLEIKPIKDWNLSRQLWWGHEIPMYECQYEGKTIWIPSSSLEEARSKASKVFKTAADDIQIIQDPDVLDTWFSSGLLSMNVGIDQKRKPPISLMVTGHDILFFWIARMVMLSIQLTGELPFKEVFLHGLICDANGKKMSKSLGNVIHPDDVINGLSASELENRLKDTLQKGQISKDNFKKALASQKAKFPKGIPECGADALRFTLCSNYIQNAFVNFDVEVCLSNKFFCNKIYQAMIYYLKIMNEYKKKRSEFDLEDIKLEKKKLNVFDQFILSKLANIIDCVNENLASTRFDFAADGIRSFMIDDLFNFYLNTTKPILERGSSLQYKTTVSVFFHCMETSLRLLSPFMPFITEYLYQEMPLLTGFDKCESITIARFPVAADWNEFRNDNLEYRFKKLANLLSIIQRTKNWFNLKGDYPNVFIKCPDEIAEVLFSNLKYVFNNMAKVRDFIRVENLERMNIIQQKIDEGFIALIEHKCDKKTLLNLFGPIISKENELHQKLRELIKTTETPEWENMIFSEKYPHKKKINNLNLELQKIKDYKFAIENCAT